MPASPLVETGRERDGAETGPVGETGRIEPVLGWFARSERPLPWRQTTPWGVLVSEFMLQQTPVARVLPVWGEWMGRWPEPGALAREPVAEALRRWGRLGYPRRARRLHEAAGVIVDRHGGQVPRSEADLLALPGVGTYTAAAVRAFAFGQRSVVLDVNVRRVLARALDGVEHPVGQPGRAELTAADLLWPADDLTSARWSAAVMELGALVCTARTPDCDACPINDSCAWLDAGQPEGTAPRRQATFEGSDRQARGRIMALLRHSTHSVTAQQVAQASPDAAQLERALAGLLRDGLVERTRNGRYRLPTR